MSRSDNQLSSEDKPVDRDRFLADKTFVVWGAYEEDSPDDTDIFEDRMDEMDDEDDEAFESFLRAGFHYLAERDGEKWERDLPELAACPEYQLTSEMDQRLQQTINEQIQVKKAHPKWIVFLVAAVLFILVSGSVVGTKIWRFAANDHGTYIGINNTSNAPDDSRYSDWTGLYQLGWLPDDYTFLDRQGEGDVVSVRYDNGQGDVITFTQFLGKTQGMVDNEGAELQKQITIQDSDGMFVVKNGIATLCWGDEVQFTLDAPCGEREMVKMAGSVYLTPEP